MTDIEEQARQLGETIKQLDEYEALVAAQEAIDDDIAVQEKLQEVRELENKLYVAHEEGEEHEEHNELHEEYEQARQELNQMNTMQQYNEVAEALSDNLSEVNGFLSEPLRIDFARFAEPDEQPE